MADASAPIPTSVLAKLDELDGQYTQIERDLESPEVVADHNRLRELSIKRAALSPVVEGYRAFRALTDEIAEMKAAIDAGDDPELAEMAREELPGLE